MKLTEVMEQISPVVGYTSVIAAFDSVRLDHPHADQVTLGGAREALAHVEHMQANAQSDAAWWGYEGQIAYWRTVVALYAAAEITGPDNLPDIEPDFLDGAHVVMDLCAYMERWGKRVLEAAQGGE